MSELGKAGKRMGEAHPSVRRRTDPKPLRATPAAKPRRKVEKPYGYSVRHKWPWREDWITSEHWYATASGRDQAMRQHQRQSAGWDWYDETSFTKIERGADTRSGGQP